MEFKPNRRLCPGTFVIPTVVLYNMSNRGQERSEVRLESQHLAILTHLDNADEPLHVNELVERLVKEGETVMSAEEYADATERKLISMHHNVLPRLANSGVIDYDQESNIVSLRDEGVEEIDWLAEESIAEVLSNLQNNGSADSDAIGMIHGRQAVIEYGRALADEAEDELFCMYVNTDLLEDDCLRHAEKAIDRGVEVYMGSRSEDVRDFTRRELPEATIWEPQRGWLNTHVDYPKVGRLVLIDRRKVMLALLNEPGADGQHPEEKAMVGEGVDNPLVVLVRELLGPRLDHLDYQSADLRSQLTS